MNKNLEKEYKKIREAIAAGKEIKEIIKLMSRKHFYDHLYNNGECSCGLETKEVNMTVC